MLSLSDLVLMLQLFCIHGTIKCLFFVRQTLHTISISNCNIISDLFPDKYALNLNCYTFSMCYVTSINVTIFACMDNLGD